MTPYPPQPQPPQKLKRFGFLALGVSAIVGMVVGGMVGALGQTSVTTEVPGPTVTVTQTAPAPDPEPTVADTPSEEPAAYAPKKADWKVTVTTRKKQCFGDAGCNVTVKTVPAYVGTRDLPDTGTIEVTYELSGDESGPIVETFTVTNGSARYTEEESLSTRSSGTKVKAKVTGVSYSDE